MESLSSTSETLNVGDTVTLTATITPAGQPIEWTTTDSAVATVNNGVVTAVGAGAVSITAQFTYNNIDYSKTCNITVNGQQVGEDAPTIEVSSATGITGKQVNVTISLKNNPGIASMYLELNFDTSKLQLVTVTDGGKLGSAVHTDAYTSPYILNWANDTATENFTYNGEVVVLTFNVLEGAELGETPITVSYNYDNYDIIDKDMNPVEFETVNGSVNIIDVIIGDVNEDGRINQLDRVILTRYIAKWTEYPEGSINTIAADVNADGRINQLDRVILTRYIAKWTGYTELPYNG